MVGWTSLYTRATMNTAIVIAPSTRPRSRACDSVWRRPIQTSAADPIAKTTSTVKCDGPKAENCRVAEIGAKSAANVAVMVMSVTPQLLCCHLCCLKREVVLTQGVSVVLDCPHFWANLDDRGHWSSSALTRHSAG